MKAKELANILLKTPELEVKIGSLQYALVGHSITSVEITEFNDTEEGTNDKVVFIKQSRYS